jgi:hypothetical protein
MNAEMEPQLLGSNSEMFSSYPAFLPLITEGETLFSWAARYHRLSGNSLAKQSSIQLYGNKRAGLRHDFPSHLQKLVEITQGQIGDAETLACERTVFGYFAPFLDENSARNVLCQMQGISVQKVKSALGLLPSRVGASFPLKCCQFCVKEDLKKYSVSRWHLEHQWPSVWICRKHQQILYALKREFQPRDLRLWLLPEAISPEKWTKHVVRSKAVLSKLHWIAEISVHFSGCREYYFDHKLLRYAYLLQAKERGWLYTDGSLKLAQVRPLFLDYYRGLDDIPGFEVVMGAKSEHAGLLGLLMRQYDWRRHPVKHILLIAFLFKSTAEFDAVYERVLHIFRKGGIGLLEETVGEEWKYELKRLVEVGHKSLSCAARTIGIPLCVAIRVSNQDGIAYQRRTRVVDTELGDNIMRMISQGLSRVEILQESGIKKSLLKDLMARNPALRDAWRIKDFERRRDEYRVNFLKLIKNLRGIPIKTIRKLPGNGVSWLYRNDRDWLIAHQPSM